MMLLEILFDGIPLDVEIFLLVSLGIILYINFKFLASNSREEPFQIEEDLHAIRQMLEGEAEKEAAEEKKPSRYAHLSDKELRRLAEEAEREMHRLR